MNRLDYVARPSCTPFIESCCASSKKSRTQKDWLCETDKAWPTIYLALARAPNAGTVARLVLGARLLYQGDDYIVSFASASQVAALAKAVESINEQSFRDLYAQIDPADAHYPLGDEDFEYTWTWMNRLLAFIRLAAQAQRAFVFTADT